MKIWISLMILGAVAVDAAGQSESNERESRHQFGVQIPVMARARVKFSARPVLNPGPDDGSGTIARFYDDGFVRVDSTGNAVAPAPPAPYSFNRTSFFGYDSAAQVANSPGATPGTDPLGGTLSLHRVTISGGDYTKSVDNDPLPGIEFFYRYDWKENGKWHLDFEAGVSFNHVSWERSGAPGATAQVLTDTYPLGGVVLPSGLAPYTGVNNTVPGIPLIGSSPSRTLATAGTAVTGNRSLDMSSLMFRLGPALDWEASDRWRLGLLGGVVLGVSYSSLEFNERLVVADPTAPTLTQAGNSSDSNLWLGLHSSARASYRLNPNWDVHGEVRHIWHDSINHSGRARNAQVDFSKGLSFILGFSRRF
jgi:hypothetical protein